MVCEGDSKGSYSQDQYQSQKINDGEIEIKSIATSKSSGTDESTTLTATVNSENKFIGLKTIAYKENTEGDSPRFVEATVVQSANNIRYVGYENSSGKINKYYSFAELIDGNDDKSLYATTKLSYGSGAALVYNDSLYSKGWNGNTLADDSSSSYLAKTQNRSEDLPSSSTAPKIKYSEAQSYDCSGDSDIDTSDVDSEDLAECAAAYLLDQEGSNMCSALSY